MPADSATLAIALLGAAASVAVYWYVYRDARRVGVSRPRAWAAFAGGALAVGVAMYVGPADLPTTGVIMTANTGLVLYTFERADAIGGSEPAEPGELPTAGGGSRPEPNGAEPTNDDGT